MPYSIKPMGNGFTVVSPNHPEGHSKKPMTKANAQAQMRIMQEAESGSNKVKAWHAQKNGRPM